MWKRVGIAVGFVVVGAPIVLAVSGCDALFGLDEVLPQCTDAQGNGADQLNAYQCVCDCSAPQGAPEHRLVAGSDDAEQHISSGAVLLDGLALELGSSGEPQKVGIRFPAVGIPKGSTILSAHLVFSVARASSGASVLKISGQASGDALPFTTTPFDVTGPGRPLTTVSVDWPVPSWPTVGLSGADQTSPDLAAIVEDVIGLTTWRPGNALAFIIEGSGQRAAVSFEGGAARSPILRVVYEPNQTILNDLFVCLPKELNPNRDATAPPTAALLEADCRDRVGATVSAMAGACGYPSACDCTATPSSMKLVCACNDDCGGDPVDATCSNFNPPTSVTATHVTGGVHVCTATSPLASALYGQRSRCEVTGNATIAIEGADDVHPAASGVVDLEASQCPGPSCAVGLKLALDLADVSVGNFWSSTTFTELAAVGESLPGYVADLGDDGAGRFDLGTTLSTGRGSREDTDEVRSVFTPNKDFVFVEAGWTPGAATCHVHGALAGSVDPEAKRCQNDANVACTTDANCPGDCTEAGTCPCVAVEPAAMNLAIDVAGSIVNQPPAANAGPDQNAECSTTGGAHVVLDGRSSFDPDGNIADQRWFRGSRVGPVAGYGATAVVSQAVATQVSYVLRVIDARGQADEDTTSVAVVDTKPPEVFCNTPTPNTISPPKAPISYRASAVDVCDPVVVPTLSDAKCFSYTKKRRIVDRTSDAEGCRVTVSGDTITISDSGGVDDYITWKASAIDDSGKRGTADCEIHVLAPAPK